MTIRTFDADQPLEPVLDVLRTSLPEVASRNTFRWKHLDSPFGASPGFLAYLDNQLVGVRFFMRWEFRLGERILHALRPVDTVTLPAARGKGVFKRLTLHGLGELVVDDYPIVFNTPNDNSLPGYLKMGWQRHGTPVAYVYRVVNPLFPGAAVDLLEGDITYPRHEYTSGLAETHKTPDFMAWRYGSPEYRRSSFATDRDAILVYTLTRKRGLKVLNVVDYCGTRRRRYALIKATARRIGAPLIRLVKEADLPNSPVSLTGGSSIVVMRAKSELLQQPFRFSNGDLQSVL